MAKVLVVDDESGIREALGSILSKQGYEVAQAKNLASAREALAASCFDAALVDMLLPDGDGRELIPAAVRKFVSVIMISGHATVSSAVEAVKAGAFDFLEKPLDRDRLLIVLRNAVRETEHGRKSGQEIMFRSEAMGSVLDLAEKFARSREPVLVCGETGSGKEMLARFVHRLSPFSRGPFVAINCAAIPENLAESELFGHVKGSFTGASEARKGKFQAADGGTLFLDEIGELSQAVQAKLLRAIEEGSVVPVGADKGVQVAVRLLAATNSDLEKLAVEGKFRQDLFYRISGLKLEIPPLRERPEDIEELAEHFLKEACEREGWAYVRPPEEFFVKVRSLEWRGNVRELKRMMTRAVLFGEGRIEASALPSPTPETPAKGGLRGAKEAGEAAKIREALRETGGNVRAACESLGISRSRLYEKMRSYSIDPGSFRAGR